MKYLHTMIRVSDPDATIRFNGRLESTRNEEGTVEGNGLRLSGRMAEGRLSNSFCVILPRLSRGSRGGPIRNTCSTTSTS